MTIAVGLGVLIGLALGSLGGGGSVLAVPVLVYVAGQSVGAATSTSLVAVGVASLVAAIGHSRSRMIRWLPAAAFVATGIAGSWAGTALNERLDGDVLLLAFSVLVLIAAQRMLTACPTCTNAGEQRVLEVEARSVIPDTSESLRMVPPLTDESGSIGAVLAPEVSPPLEAGRFPRRAFVKLLVAGSIVGFLTGLFGVGGGFVIVPALTLVLGLSMRAAIGTSLVVIVGNTLVSLAFRGVGAVDWAVAVPFTMAMLVGSALGSVVAHRLPQKRSLQVFAVLLAAVALANGAAAGIALTTG